MEMPNLSQFAAPPPPLGGELGDGFLRGKSPEGFQGASTGRYPVTTGQVGEVILPEKLLVFFHRVWLPVVEGADVGDKVGYPGEYGYPRLAAGGDHPFDLVKGDTFVVKRADRYQ